MNILSIDPSLTGTAFALLELQGGHLLSVETFFVNNSKNAKMGNGVRLKLIADELNFILSDTEVDHVAIEKQFTRFNVATQAMFRVVGVIEKELAQNGLCEIEYFSPTSVKKSVTGNGKSSKDEVQDAVRVFLPENLKDMEFLTNDCSDAVAIGIAFCLDKSFLKSFSKDVTKAKPSIEKKVKGDNLPKTKKT